MTLDGRNRAVRHHDLTGRFRPSKTLLGVYSSVLPVWVHTLTRLGAALPDDLAAETRTGHAGELKTLGHGLSPKICWT
jgi:hypothetical protein